jgi:hypothetical protein
MFYITFPGMCDVADPRERELRLAYPWAWVVDWGGHGDSAYSAAARAIFFALSGSYPRQSGD